MKPYFYVSLFCVLLLSGCSVTHYISEGVATSDGRVAEIALVLKDEDNHIRLESCGGLIAQPSLAANYNAPIQLLATDEEYITHEVDLAGNLNKLAVPIKSRDNNKPCIAVWANSKPATRNDFSESAIPVIYFMCTPEKKELTHKFADAGRFTLGPIRVEKSWHLPLVTAKSPKHCNETN